MVSECSACGSKRLARVLAGAWFRLALYAPGGSPLGRGRHASGLRAAACVDCGNVQLIADELDSLRRVYEQQHSDALRLDA
jgi:hypothetical protein